LSEKTRSKSCYVFRFYSRLILVSVLFLIFKDSPKIVVGHIVNALKPKPLQARVSGNLEFSHSHLKKDFHNFMPHVLNRAEKCGTQPSVGRYHRGGRECMPRNSELKAWGRRLIRLLGLRYLSSVETSISLNRAHKRGNIASTRSGVTVYFFFLGRCPRSDIKWLPWRCPSPSGFGDSCPNCQNQLSVSLH
jgi:hypothetical protein